MLETYRTQVSLANRGTPRLSRAGAACPPATRHHLFGFVFEGTFPPFFRAFDSPMAMACFGFFTLVPALPLFSLPRLSSCMDFLTCFCAVLPYLAMTVLLSLDDDAPRQFAQGAA